MSGDSYGPVDINEMENAIDVFMQMGGYLFETAASYGLERQSEVRLASILKKICLRTQQKPKVITKIGNLPHVGQEMPQQWDAPFLLEQINIANDIFGDLLGGILLHSPPKHCDIEYLLKILSENLRTKGKKIGIALSTVTDLENKEIIKAIKNNKPDIVTLNFSLMDQRLNDVNGLKVIKENVGEIWARTVFNFGFIADPELKIGLTDDHRNTWSKEQIQAWRNGGRLFKALASEFGTTTNSLAINFCMENQYINGVCLGMNSRREVLSNMLSAREELSKKMFNKVESLYAANTFFIK
jgi:aryl-alcohol dehydrogenase-like predicted oxidoreductase